MPTTLGERIKIVRNKRKVTQKEFSERICVSQSYVSRLESDREVPTDMLIKLISLEFDVNYGWLQEGRGNPFIEESKDYDYWERDHAEDVHKSVSIAISELSENLEKISDPSINFLVTSAIQNINWLTALYTSDKNFGIPIIEKLTDIILSFYERVEDIHKLDKNDEEYVQKLYKHIWTAADEMRGSMQQVGEAYVNKIK